MKLIVAPQTAAQLDALATNPPHALLFIGPNGIGKFALAHEWAAKLTAPENIVVIEPDEKGTISIDTIRTLYGRTSGRQSVHQVVIVDHAEGLGGEAQNAFLKLLEEPRTGVTFILTAPSTEALLPTILSRVQQVQVHRVSFAVLTTAAREIQPNIAQQDLAQLLFMADGRPATLLLLLQDESALSKYREIMQLAKKLLTAPPFERLARVSDLSKDRAAAITLLEAMAYMTKGQLQRAYDKKFLALADALETCLARLAQNGNVRAQLTNLFLRY